MIIPKNYPAMWGTNCFLWRWTTPLFPLTPSLCLRLLTCAFSLCLSLFLSPSPLLPCYHTDWAPCCSSHRPRIFLPHSFHMWFHQPGMFFSQKISMASSFSSLQVFCWSVSFSRAFLDLRKALPYLKSHPTPTPIHTPVLSSYFTCHGAYHFLTY